MDACELTMIPEYEVDAPIHIKLVKEDAALDINERINRRVARICQYRIEEFSRVIIMALKLRRAPLLSKKDARAQRKLEKQRRRRTKKVPLRHLIFQH